MPDAAAYDERLSRRRTSTATASLSNPAEPMEASTPHGGGQDSEGDPIPSVLIRDRLQLSALAQDCAGGGLVVLLAGQQQTWQTNASRLIEGKPKRGLRVTVSAMARPNGVANMSGPFAQEVGVNGMPQRQEPNQNVVVVHDPEVGARHRRVRVHRRNRHPPSCGVERTLEALHPWCDSTAHTGAGNVARVELTHTLNPGIESVWQRRDQ